MIIMLMCSAENKLYLQESSLQTVIHISTVGKVILDYVSEYCDIIWIHASLTQNDE